MPCGFLPLPLRIKDTVARLQVWPPGSTGPRSAGAKPPGYEGTQDGLRLPEAQELDEALRANSHFEEDLAAEIAQVGALGLCSKPKHRG